MICSSASRQLKEIYLITVVPRLCLPYSEVAKICTYFHHIVSLIYWSLKMDDNVTRQLSANHDVEFVKETQAKTLPILQDAILGEGQGVRQ